MPLCLQIRRMKEEDTQNAKVADLDIFDQEEG